MAICRSQAGRQPGAGQGRRRVGQSGRHVRPQRGDRLKLPKPFIVGCDLAGMVEAVGRR